MSNSEYDRLKAQKDAIEIRQDYQKHDLCRTAYTTLDAELKAAKDRIAERDETDRWIGEFKSKLKQLQAAGDLLAEEIILEQTEREKDLMAKVKDRDARIAELEAACEQAANSYQTLSAAANAELAASQAREKELEAEIELLRRSSGNLG